MFDYDINLNILECKFILSCWTFSISPDINLNILECKCLLIYYIPYKFVEY